MRLATNPASRVELRKGPHMILYFAADLLWASKIKLTADAIGIVCRPVRSVSMLEARLADTLADPNPSKVVRAVSWTWTGLTTPWPSFAVSATTAQRSTRSGSTCWPGDPTSPRTF